MDKEQSPDPPEPEAKSSDSTSSPQAGFSAFWAELKRRHVVRVAMVYLVVGWLVIQVANATFSDFGIPIWAYRFVVLMVALGFPISVVVAWAFELTPQGIKTSKTAREEHPNSHKDESHAKKRHWFSLGLAAAVPTVIFGALALFFLIKSGDTPDAGYVEYEKSIAVLPFTNMSANQEHSYFADGVHETILTDLANLRDMRVVSRTSVMPYRGSDKSIITIGQELGVAYILEGSMQRAENAFRLTAQLIDARSDEHLWAKNFDGELTNIFSVQSQLAKDVAQGLQAILSPQEKRQLERAKSASIEAYDLYLQALKFLNTNSFAYRDTAELLDRVVAIDPTFTDAWLKIASLRGNVYLGGRDRSLGNEQKIKRAIDTAVRLEPDNPNVKVGLGIYYYNCHLDYSRARFHIEPVIDELPNHAEALLALSGISEREGRYAEAVYHLNNVHLRDPNLSSPLLGLRNIYHDHRDWKKSAEVNDKLVAISPEESYHQFERARVEYYDHGSVEEANRLFAGGYTENLTEDYHYAWLYNSGNLQAFRDEGIIDSWKERAYIRQLSARNWWASMQLVVLTLLDETDFAREVFDSLREEAKQRDRSALAQSQLGFAHAVAGDYEKAFIAIDSALALRPESSDADLGLRNAYWRAVILGWVGEKDESVAELKRLVRKPNRFINYYRLKTSLDLHPLREHPGFQELLEDPALKQPIPIKNW